MEFDLNCWTDLKESKALVEAGLKPDTADMHHFTSCEKWYDTSLCYDENMSGDKDYLPCWSLGRLINLMPKRIGLYTLVWDISGGVVEYRKNLGDERTDTFATRFDIPTMVIWLLNNGYMDDYKQKKMFTTIKQSKRLLKAGVDSKTADLYYLGAEGEEGLCVGKSDNVNSTPAWSLGALINLFPCGSDAPVFELTRGGWSGKADKHTNDWFAEYENEGSINKCFWITKHSKTATDAVVKLIVELKKKKLL